MLRLIYLITILSLPVISEVIAQSPSNEINIKNYKCRFSGIAVSKKHGLLFTGIKPESKDLILVYFDTLLNEKWNVKIDNSELGYIDPYVDSRDLYIYFSGEFIYMAYLSNRINQKNTLKLYSFDYTGKMVKTSYSGTEEEMMLFPFLEANKLNIAYSNRNKSEYFYIEFDGKNPVTGKKKLSLPGSVPGSLSRGHDEFILHAYNKGYEGSNDLVTFFTRADKNGKLRAEKKIRTRFSENTFPCPDIDKAYGTSNYYNYYRSSLSTLEIMKDSYIYRGMYASDADLRQKAGIYIVNVDTTLNVTSVKEHSFEKLKPKFKALELLSGYKMFNTSFCSMGRYHFYLFKNFTKKETVGIVLSETGELLNAFEVSNINFSGEHRFALSISGNSGIQSDMSAFFTSNQIFEYLNIKPELKTITAESKEKEFPLNLVNLGEREYLVRYDQKSNLISFYLNK